MPTLGAWIKRTVQQVLDPDREQRIQEVAALMPKALETNRNKFSFVEFSNRVNCSEQDLEHAKRNVFGTLLDRAWRDGKVKADEKNVLKWAADRLELPTKEADIVQRQCARDRFAVSLAKAMDDGVIDDHEASELSDIAQSINVSIGDFVSTYFLSEGESFLRGVFAACTQDGILAEEAWARLIKTTERLGISRDALTSAIRPQAERFIEHVLADAKSDGEFTEEEEKQLKQLIQTMGLSARSHGYFFSEIAALKVIRNARDGKLPTLDRPHGVSIRSGEIVHLHESAMWHQRRLLKSGDVWDKHIGTISITDNRLIFSSDTKSFDVRYNKIVGHSGQTGQIRIQRAEKPESIIRLDEWEATAYAILAGAIALANQTQISKQESAASRHIPREVRQRVWQLYGGQCAECGDTQYLEFDHVIPVAKGGSNSDANVQLLCRKCNLKKSDFI